MIEADGIILRALEPEDVDLLYEWENDMEIWVVSNTLIPFSRYQLNQYIENSKLSLHQIKQLRLIIEVKDDEKFFPVGMIDLFDFDPFHSRGGIGIIIQSTYQKQGYAKRALGLFVEYCFNHLLLNQLYANILVDNKASISLFESLGFTLSGNMRQWRRTADGFVDELFYQKLNSVCKKT